VARLWITVALLALACGTFRASADELLCAIRAPGDETANLREFHETPDDSLLLGAEKGLFRYDGGRTVKVKGDETSRTYKFYDMRDGLLLLLARKGLFRYEAGHATKIKGDDIGSVHEFHESPQYGLLLAATNGLSRYKDQRVTKVQGEQTDHIYLFHDTLGQVLLASYKGLFRFKGSRVTKVPGDERINYIEAFHDTPRGVLIGASNGLFRFDGERTTNATAEPILDGWTGQIHEFLVWTPAETLLATDFGLFRYDGTRVAKVAGEETGRIYGFFRTSSELLVGAENGLFLYEGAKTKKVMGSQTGPVFKLYDDFDGVLLMAGNGLFRYKWGVNKVEGEKTGSVGKLLHPVAGGFLFSASQGLFRYDGNRIAKVQGEETGQLLATHNIWENKLVAKGTTFNNWDGQLLGMGKGLFHLASFLTAKPILGNAQGLMGSPPNDQGVHTYWTVTHPCSAYADRFHLHVVATDANGNDLDAGPATGFKTENGTTSFRAVVPIHYEGKWTFRVVTKADGKEINIGQHSDQVTFISPKFLEQILAHWKSIAGFSTSFLIIFNIFVFAAARYSPAAWRLATNDLWGKNALLLQNLMLRHLQSAQLWLLSLYVSERRNTIGDSSPYLPLPLTNSTGKFANSDELLKMFGYNARHLWVQGGTGMGKTALFWHLCQTHFGDAQDTAAKIFRRNGYILVPIEARRYPEAPFEEKGASAWVITCVLAVLSERGLSFQDRGLLRAMLYKGTLGVAIDGLNEVARGQAVSAFAAEFPQTPLFVTSQEAGEEPFEVWRLPRTIDDQVEGLLSLYLGSERGQVLKARLLEGGLLSYLRSGYDVRLVIDLFKADPAGATLPVDRIGLYRAAVADAWPENDERLETLEGAAWKLISKRGPNEDKRRLKPDDDAPKDLLEKLEAVREQYGRNVRLVRAAPPYFEFVHDQMNAYLAACWLTSRATFGAMKSELEDTKIWLDGADSQRTLWGFVAVLLNQATLENLWIFSGDDEKRGILQRALAERAEREGWPLTRPPRYKS
jgi:hypothetical protein